MVLESNFQFHQINKHCINFILEMKDSAEILAAWKDKTNINKLKNLLKTKDEKPKRIISKYLFFCQEERVRILKENPTMNIRTVTCELGRRWQEFQESPDPIRMKKITELFEDDKKRYDIAKYQISQKKEPKKKLPLKSAYLVFCEEERSHFPKITMKELGVKWAIVKQDINLFEQYKIMVPRTLISC